MAFSTVAGPFLFVIPVPTHTRAIWSIMLSSHITGFPPSYIPYQRHPSCSLFPIEACSVSQAVRRIPAWMVFQQPYDPVCLGMDVCILPGDTQNTSGVGTVIECCAMVESWVVYRVELQGGLVMNQLLLYVPVIWADVSSYVPRESRAIEWARFLWLGGVAPRMLNRRLKRKYTPRSVPVWCQVEDECSRSSETITPRTMGYNGA